MNQISSTPMDPGPFVEPDLDAGTQPADINAIGYTASRFPLKKVMFFVVVIAVALGVLYLLTKNWIVSKFSTPVAITKKDDSTTPSEGSQRANRPNLPGANTPLDFSSITPTPSPAPATKPDQSCKETALIDKRTNQVVKDAQGQNVMVDCKGVMVSARAAAPVVPAPAQPVQYTGIGVAQPAQAVPTAPDRYAGDTSLGAKKAGSSTPSAIPSIASFPPPPVSSSELETRLKRIMTPTQTPASSAINPILANANTNASGNPQGAMGGLLSPTSTPKALAMRTFDPNLTIPKGDSINCAMTTRVVTEISGFTSCIVSENVYSANGKVLLIERMSEIQGEYTAVGQPGQRRVYVLWSRVRKPGGITIDIASPSTDALGAAGIDGIVDNRWFERIGSAYMLSIFKDFLAASAAASAGGTAAANTATGSALYQNSISTSTSLAEKVLSQSINIKPVVYANQGERIAIYVARDLDFSGIYQVTPVKRK